MSEERVPKFENAMKRLTEHALKEDKRKKPRVEATTGRQRTVEDTDWDDIGKRVSKQIKVTDGRIIYTPDSNVSDDIDPTAGSSRDKRASETAGGQSIISKKLQMYELGAVSVDLDDLGFSGIGGPKVDLVEI